MKLADIKKLKQKKYRNEFGYVFLEGSRFVQEAEASDFTKAEILSTSKFEGLKTRFRKRIIDDIQFKKISDLEEPQGIGILIELSEFKKIEKTNSAVFLDRIQDPGNLGSIIRSMAWFGNYHLYCSEGSVDAFNPKVLRASAGGHFHVHIEENVHFHDIAYHYEEQIALDLNGKKLNQLKATNSQLLIFGNEGNGLSDSILNSNAVDRYRISGTNHIDSLNVASALSIVLHHCSK